MSTRRGDVHYVHALNYNADRVSLDNLPANITRAALLDGTPLTLGAARDRRYVTVPAAQRDPLATVIKLW